MSKLFDELMALKKAYNKKLVEEGEQAVKEAFKEFFDKYPRASSVSWYQYTPYFNDGDACTFSVHNFNLTLGEVEEEELELVTVDPSLDPEDEDDYDDEEEHSAWSLSESDDPELKSMSDDLGELQSIPDDVLENVFGDHVRITATREGFDVTEFEHD